MEHNSKELEAIIQCERSESPEERCEVLDHQPMMTPEEAMQVLNALGVPTSRSRKELEEDLSQIVTDAQVISELSKRGGDPERTREVRHWAYFKVKKSATKFAKCVASAGYRAVVLEASSTGREFRVRFAREGSLQLSSIAAHSVRLRRLAANLKGSYDGWEVTFSVDETGTGHGQTSLGPRLEVPQGADASRI